MSRNEQKKTGVMSGMAWAFAERISAQLVTFLVSIVLARLLSPDEYALVAIAMIFITIANVFVSSGFGNALIQKIDADELDFSTTLYFSFGISVIVYIILFMTAPIISAFYQLPGLTPLIRVMSLRIVVAPVNSVQQAYVSRRMEFRKFFYSTIIGTAVSAVLGVIAAFCGFGVWALAIQYLSNVFIDTVVLFFTSGWRPHLMFSWNRMKPLLGYGWKVLTTDLISKFYEQMHGLVLSKVVSSSALAFYNQGEKFPALFINNIETSIHKVMMPVVAKEQRNIERVLTLTRKTIVWSTFLIFPLLTGLAVVGEPLITLLYTKKWLPCVPYMQIICITYLMKPIIESHTRTMKALGRSDLLIKMTIIRYTAGFILLIAAVLLSGEAMMIVLSWTMSTGFAVLLCAIINQKLIGYSFCRQIGDVGRTLLACIGMGIITAIVGLLNLSMGSKLLFQTLVGVISYILLSLFLNREVVMEVFGFIKKTRTCSGKGNV